MMTMPFTIAVDFDGTIVEHAYPAIGPLVPGAIDVLQECISKGAQIILFTVRDGVELDAAVQFLEENGVRPSAVNENPACPSRSAKPYYDVLVDDRALGCPIMPGFEVRNRPCVDWGIVGPQLQRLIESGGWRKWR